MTANSNRKRGKANESALAKRVGGKRMGILGHDDVQTGTFSIEAKSRVSFCAQKWMEQSQRNAKGKIPLVVVHVLGKHRNNDLVLIRLEDWIDLYGNPT